MPKYIIANYSDSQGVKVTQVEAEDRNVALKCFFEDSVSEYSKDAEGFAFFKEDFFDLECPLGDILEVEE